MSSLIITRGLGKCKAEKIEYIPIAVCEPDVISYEYGEKHMTSKEIKPIMTAEKPPRVCKEEGEE